MMKNEILESLLFHKTLKIVFNDGRILIIDTFCSGSAEDTTMTFSKE